MTLEKFIVVTKDGSNTVSIPGLQVTYHSLHGAIQESMHVFINAGLLPLISKNPSAINVLEIGLGTGLNALLTLTEAEKKDQQIHYTAIDPFPLTITEAALLNYCGQLNRNDLQPVFKAIHECEFEKDIALSEHFVLRKIAISIQEHEAANQPGFQPFQLVYYDAFAPAAQPELWTKEIFSRLFNIMETGGSLVTYCSKSIVRRAMKSAGFEVEKIPGPLGKREMVRAVKP